MWALACALSISLLVPGKARATELSRPPLLPGRNHSHASHTHKKHTEHKRSAKTHKHRSRRKKAAHKRAQHTRHKLHARAQRSRNNTHDDRSERRLSETSAATSKKMASSGTAGGGSASGGRTGAGGSASGGGKTGTGASTQAGQLLASNTSPKVVPFSPASPWNAPIPARPALDPASTAIAGYLGSEMKAFADLYEYGAPVWDATSSDPYNSVGCTEPWGTCELSQQPIPIPAETATSSGGDGSMVVIDWSSGYGYDFWRAARTSSSSWTAAWGTRFSLNGSGTGGGATGAGVPLLAGLPRLWEMEHGEIGHALAFVSDNTCASAYRYPASKTDGKSTRGDCIPEGARIQLDPGIDIDAIPGITQGEKIVAHALQRYGAYCKDSGGAKLAFGFEDPAGKRNPYPALGFAWDYYDMPHIPWNRLRVLASWSGS